MIHSGDRARTLAHRLWIYQAERFPLAQHGPAVALFAVSGVLVTARVIGSGLPSAWTFVVAFALSLLLFLQLRIADEFKDAEDDRRFRPERPVPRGLVSLRLLAGIAAGSAVAELVLALSLAPLVAGLLVMAWAWIGLMTVEFGAGRRLRARPVLYLVSHMAIMPLIALLVTGCVWVQAGLPPPDWVLPFLALAFANGCVLEIGRKTWAPEEEREGVETYSSLWGSSRAAGAWLLSLGGAGVCTALSLIGVVAGSAGVTPVAEALLAAGLAAILMFAAAAGLRFQRAPSLARRKRLSIAAALWVLASYLILGIASWMAMPAA
ncbi:MAG: UbiA family prenyltransferase [Alphaproteobacteria bacterium]